MSANTENRVPNEKIREAFLKSGISAGEVALRCGWHEKRDRQHGNSSKVKRALGIIDSVTVKKSGTVRRKQETIAEDDAVMILDAIGVAPWEVDL